MLNRLLPAVLLAFSFFVIVPAQAADAPKDATLERVQSTGGLTLGVRENALPFAAIVGGHGEGYSVDVCLRIVQRLEKLLARKITPRFVAVPIDQVPARLADGQIDIDCANAVNRAELHSTVAYSYPLFFAGVGFAVSSQAGAVQRYDQLTGRSIAVVVGSRAQGLLNAELKALQLKGQSFTVVPLPDLALALTALLKREVTAVCADDVAMLDLLAQTKLSDQVRLLNRRLSIEPYSLAMRRADSEFAAVIDREMESLIATGELRKVAMDWLSRPQAPYPLGFLTLEALRTPVKQAAFP
jgi:glutamate/aspartate transport system substrate-binding protein